MGVTASAAAAAAAAAVGSIAVGCVCCYFAAKRAAFRAMPTDTSTICGISRVGLLCKLSFLMKWPIPNLESARFAFLPAQKAPAADDAASRTPLGYEALLAHCTRGKAVRNSNGSASASDEPAATRAAATTTTQACDTAPSSTLVVAFSGGAVNKIGLSRMEFRRMLSARGSATAHVDQLYVLDPTGMSFYSHDLAAFTARLRRVVEAYDRVVFIGNCMGGSAVLRFAPLLRPTDTVLAFNPEVDPRVDPRRPFRMAARLAPRDAGGLAETLRTALQRTRARIHVHSSAWPPERDQARLLLRFMTPTLTPTGEWPNWAVRAMDDSGVPSTETALAALRHPAERTRVLFEHRDCGYHGMLAKLLRPNGSLRAILDDAVS